MSLLVDDDSKLHLGTRRIKLLPFSIFSFLKLYYDILKNSFDAPIILLIILEMIDRSLCSFAVSVIYVNSWDHILDLDTITSPSGLFARRSYSAGTKLA